MKIIKNGGKKAMDIKKGKKFLKNFKINNFNRFNNIILDITISNLYLN
jgi:hypothetical protein